MENHSNIKALFIVSKAGFAEEVMDIARAAGAAGGTIINSRGEGTVHKSFLGITIDSEKEIIVTLVPEDIAEKIMIALKENRGLGSAIKSLCFVLPVDRMTQINTDTQNS